MVPTYFLAFDENVLDEECFISSRIQFFGHKNASSVQLKRSGTVF